MVGLISVADLHVTGKLVFEEWKKPGKPKDNQDRSGAAGGARH